MTDLSFPTPGEPITLKGDVITRTWYRALLKSTQTAGSGLQSIVGGTGIAISNTNMISLNAITTGNVLAYTGKGTGAPTPTPIKTLANPGPFLINTSSDDGINQLQVAGGANITGGLEGVINGSNATAGYVGQTVASSVVSPGSSLSSGTPLNVTSISMPAGDFDVWGWLAFTGASATTITLIQGGINIVSATLPTSPAEFANEYLAGATFATLGADMTLTGFTARANASSAQNWYLVAKATFGVSTLSAYGAIVARRRR